MRSYWMPWRMFIRTGLWGWRRSQSGPPVYGPRSLTSSASTPPAAQRTVRWLTGSRWHNNTQWHTEASLHNDFAFQVKDADSQRLWCAGRKTQQGGGQKSVGQSVIRYIFCVFLNQILYLFFQSCCIWPMMMRRGTASRRRSGSWGTWLCRPRTRPWDTSYSPQHPVLWWHDDLMMTWAYTSFLS